MTATQTEIDQATYDAWTRNDRNDSATAREIGVTRGTVAARVIRVQRRARDLEIAQYRAGHPDPAGDALVAAAMARAAGSR
jgi:hypothetical protein